MAAAHARSRSEQAIAFQGFTDDENMGLTNGVSFAQWLEAGKAPSYSAAIRREQQIGAQLESIQSAIAGPKAAPRAEDRVAINKGFSDTAWAGYANRKNSSSYGRCELTSTSYNMDAAVGNRNGPHAISLLAYT